MQVNREKHPKSFSEKGLHLENGSIYKLLTIYLATRIKGPYFFNNFINSTNPFNNLVNVFIHRCMARFIVLKCSWKPICILRETCSSQYVCCQDKRNQNIKLFKCKHLSVKERYVIMYYTFQWFVLLCWNLQKKRSWGPFKQVNFG